MSAVKHPMDTDDLRRATSLLLAAANELDARRSVDVLTHLDGDKLRIGLSWPPEMADSQRWGAAQVAVEAARKALNEYADEVTS